MSRPRVTAKKKAPRRKAPALLTAIDRAREQSTDHRVRALLHELQVHTEEITVQNEQLQRAQHELEQARDRYADLYDFAPIGYIALNPAGAILEINLMASMLLGRPRHLLINLPVLPLIAAEDRDVFREFLLRCAQIDGGQAPDVEIRLRGEPRRTVRMMARPLSMNGGFDQIFMAMIDVSDERRLQRERQALYEREQARSAELAAEVLIRQDAEERVKALLGRLVEVQEQERRRLALNLHDHLGQQLTALRLTLTALKGENLTSAQGQQRLAMLEHIVNQLDRDVDFLAWELRPAALDDMGLDLVLEQFIRRWSATQGVVAECHTSSSDEARLTSEIESHLYRIVQEALNNISKHADASHVSVLLERRDGQATLIVEDDGRGFDLNEVRARADIGMGLAGIQERAASVGGAVQYESAPGKGTTLFVRIPLQLEKNRDKAKRAHSRR
jgi:PAS domain S-box-containing protein